MDGSLPAGERVEQEGQGSSRHLAWPQGDGRGKQASAHGQGLVTACGLGGPPSLGTILPPPPPPPPPPLLPPPPSRWHVSHMGGVGGRGPSCFVFRGSDAEPDPDLDAKQVGRWALLTHVRPLFVLPRLKLDFQNSTLSPIQTRRNVT